MAHWNAQATVEASLLGRLVAFAYTVWDESGINRLLTAVGRLVGQVFAGSVFGRVWYSNWPTAGDVDGSLAGCGLIRLGEAVDAAGRRLGPYLARFWAGSLLVRAGQAVVRWASPYLETSLLWGVFTGYPQQVALAPAEDSDTRTSPLVYLLGALLGLLPLVPTNFRLGPIPVPSPTVLMIAGTWVLALLWLGHRFISGAAGWRGSSAFLPVAFLLTVAAAATLQSVSLSASLLSLMIWLTAGLLFFMTVNLVRSSRDAAALLGPVLAGAALMTVWAVYQFIVPPQIDESWVDPATSGQLVRSFASLGNPNYLAEYMALYLPLGIALWLQHPRRRLIMALPVLGMALSLALTYSRGGYLALIIALGVFMLMRFRRWLVPLILLGIAGVAFAPQSVLNRFETGLVDLGRMVTALTSGSQIELADTSNTYRVNLWIGVLHMLQQYWAVGAGLGAEASVMVYQEFMLAGVRAAHSHNTYLQVLVEMGVLGLVAVLWTLLVIIRRTFVVGVNPRSALLVAAVPAALAGMLFHGMVEHIWYNPKLLFAFWAVAGLGMGLTLGHREDAAA